jgi:cbb3-type cytochrome oxidase maturation protein
MEALYLLIPMSALGVLGILGVFAWALHRDQFEDLQAEGERILEDERLDIDQGEMAVRQEQS